MTDNEMRILDHPDEVPAAAWYVLVTDTFMSGWGPAEGKTNRLVFPCDSFAEAESVASYAASRTDTENVRVEPSPPPAFWRCELGQLMTPEVAPAWYRRAQGGAA